MANRYLKAAGGNSNAAATWSATGSDGVDDAGVPVAADEVYLVAGSGQLTINATFYCRSFNATGYANTITHNAGIFMNIGDATYPTGGIALILAGTYTILSTNTKIAFLSSSTDGVHTIDTGGKTIQAMQFTAVAKNYQFVNSPVVLLTDASYSLNHESGTLDFNDLPVSVTGKIQSINNTARTLTFGSSLITIGSLTFSGSNLTISENTANFIIAINSIITLGNNGDLNGASIIIRGATSISIITAIIVNNFVIDNLCAVSLSNGGVTVEGDFVCDPTNGVATLSNVVTSTITKTSGDIHLYQCLDTALTFVGGVNVYSHNNSNVIGATPVTRNFYVNPIVGDNSIQCAYGMYKVAYTDASGTCPIVGEVLHGETSGATGVVSHINEYYFNTWKAGTIYISVKTGTFTSEILHGNTNDGHLTIAADFVNAAWESLAGSVGKVNLGDNIYIAETPTYVKPSVAIISSTDATPIAIHAHAHGLATGDEVVIAGHETNVAANGTWVVAVSGADDFTLNTSVGSGAGVGGATGTSTIKGIGMGLWTGQPTTLPAAKVIAGCTNAGGLVNIHIHSHGYSNGDVVMVYGQTGSYDANGCWSITSVGADDFTLDGSVYEGTGTATGNVILVNRAVVKLSTAQTLSITKGQLLWTNVAATSIARNTTYFKDGMCGIAIVKSSSFATNTLLAYLPIGTLDLSSYNKLSFHITHTNTPPGANQYYICLCSGASGTGVVNTFKIPATANQGYYRVMAYTLSAEEGTTLYNGVQSIALYTGSTTPIYGGFVLGDFIACKTDSLCLNSVISKNTLSQGGSSSVGYANEAWYPIKNISKDGKIIFLEQDILAMASSNLTSRQLGYFGSTGTVTTYLRNPAMTHEVNANIYIFNLSKSVPVGNPITYEGGYNLVTGSCTGESFLMSRMGHGVLIYSNLPNFTLNHISLFGAQYGMYLISGSQYVTISNMTNCSNNTGVGIYLSSSHDASIINLINCIHNNGGISASSCNNLILTAIQNIIGNIGSGISLTSCTFGSSPTITNSSYNTVSGVLLTTVNGQTITLVPTTIYNGDCGISLVTSNGNVITTIPSSLYNSNAGIFLSGSGSNIITTITASNYNTVYGIYLLNSNKNTITTIVDANYNATGIYLSASHYNIFSTLGNINNCTYGISIAGSFHNVLKNGNALTAATGGLNLSSFGRNVMKNFTISGTEYVMGTMVNEDHILYIENYNASGYEKIFSYYATMISKVSTLTGGSGKEWQIEITNALRTSSVPFRQVIAVVYLSANMDNTFTLYMKKSHGTNIVAQMVCMGGQIAGIDTDVKSTDLVNTTETQVSLVLHPTAAGVVEIEMQAYWGGATANVIFDQLGRS
jgi:hypothetical protein